MSEEIEKLKEEAQKYRSMKVKSAAAEKLFEASVRLKDKGEDAQAIDLMMQAIRLYEEERTGTLEEFLEKAAPVLDALGQFKLAAETYFKAAKQHIRRADHRGAIPDYVKAADAYKRGNLFSDLAQTFGNIADEYVSLSEPILAAGEIEKEADARLQIKDVSGAVSALHSARELYHEAGHFTESARCSKRAAESLVQAGNNRDGERHYLQAAEDLQLAAGEMAKANDHIHASSASLEAATIYVKAKRPAEASKCHLEAAEAELRSGNINAASDNFRKAVIEQLLAGEIGKAREIIGSIKSEDIKKTTAFKQSLALTDAFEKRDEEGLNAIMREINDFSWVQLSLAFGRLIE